MSGRVVSNPWDNWPVSERETIVADYLAGASLRQIAIRYHRDSRGISRLLHSRGVMKAQGFAKPVRTVRRVPTPGMVEFGEMLWLFVRRFGRKPTRDEATSMIESVHYAYNKPLPQATPAKFEAIEVAGEGR